jgi:LysM repeat protein
MQKDEIPNKSHSQTNKSVLIFSAVTALFVGIMGYEIIRDNDSQDLIKAPEKKFSILLNSSQDLLGKPERAELKLLHAQNHHFSSKIIALKEEAHAAQARLHTLQLSIFSAEKEKERRELQQLQESLAVEESVKHELSHEIAELEKNIQMKEAQISNMESAIDILDEIVHSQKKRKLESHSQFKQQFVTLQNDSENEKTRLQQLIHQLEVNQTALKIQMQDHNQEVEKLEDEISRLNLLHLDKELEADYLTENLKSQHGKLTSQAENLSYVIEAENLQLLHFQKELHYLETELSVKQEKLKETQNELENIAQLTAEANQKLENQNSEIALKDELINHLKNSHDELNEHSKQAYRSLNESFFIEQKSATVNRINDLHELVLYENLSANLLEDLRKKNSELEQFKNVHHALSHDRNTLKSLIDDKLKEISDLEKLAANKAKHYEETILSLEENIEKLTLNFHLELQKAAELENDILSKESLLKEKEQSFEEAYQAKTQAQNELQERIAVLSNALQDLENNHQIHLDGHVNLVKEKEDQENILNERISSHNTEIETRLKLEKELNELTTLLTMREHELNELKELSLLKQHSNEELSELLIHAQTELQKNLETFNITFSQAELSEKLVNQKENELKAISNEYDTKLANIHASHSEEVSALEFELMQTKDEKFAKDESHKKLQVLLDEHQKKIEDLSAAYSEQVSLLQNEIIQTKEEKLVKDESNERLQTLLAEHQNKLEDLSATYSGHLSLLENELEKTLDTFKKTFAQAELAEKMIHEKEEELNHLRELLSNRETELNQVKEIAYSHETSKEQLQNLLAEHENKIHIMETNFSEKASLNEKIRAELELYQQALDKAIILQDIEKKASSDLQSKLQELNDLLESQENKLLIKDEAFKGTIEANEALSQEIQKTQESFKTILEQYEDAQNNRLEHEKNVNHLTELLLHRERELEEIKELMLTTTHSNEKLSAEIEKQHENLDRSFTSFKEAEARAEQAEESLYNLSDLLKIREAELLETHDVKSNIEQKNQELANELHKHKQELDSHLQAYRVAQEKTHDNEQQLHAMIELLVRREEELLKKLEEKHAENNDLEKREIETKNYLNKTEQSRQSLLTELEKSRGNHATLLNDVQINNSQSNLSSYYKTHTIAQGDTLRGISLRYYGSPNRWKEIYQANSQVIPDQDKIPVGTVITIP